jgi:hypothetical protein
VKTGAEVRRGEVIQGAAPSSLAFCIELRTDHVT